MQIQVRRVGMGWLLGLSALLGLLGCSESNSPDAAPEVTSNEVEDLKAKLIVFLA